MVMIMPTLMTKMPSIMVQSLTMPDYLLILITINVAGRHSKVCRNRIWSEHHCQETKKHQPFLEYEQENWKCLGKFNLLLNHGAPMVHGDSLVRLYHWNLMTEMDYAC
jgi:hypothetical protein